MKKVGIGIVIGIIIIFIFQYYQKEKQNKTEIIENTTLIQKQIKNVGKLVVTEGYFSEVITYKDAKQYLGNLISFDKKALVVVNAEATISYDLSQISYQIDEQNKIVKITIKQKIEKSSLVTNAENRLITELSKILILTNSMGWTLEYNQSVIQKEEDFKIPPKG